MKPELGKYYRTRSGHKVRVICTDAKIDKLPVVALVEADGCENSCQYTEYGSYWASGKAHEWDLVSEWIDKPEWDWSKSANWHVAIAMDEDRRWFSYTGEPRTDNIVWVVPNVQLIPPEHAPKWTGDWKDSLIVRPGFEKGESK